jgi:hypothetical protein
LLTGGGGELRSHSHRFRARSVAAGVAGRVHEDGQPRDLGKRRPPLLLEQSTVRRKVVRAVPRLWQS